METSPSSIFIAIFWIKETILFFLWVISRVLEERSQIVTVNVTNKHFTDIS